MKIVLYIITIFLSISSNNYKKHTLKVGDSIPDFSATDNHGYEFNSLDYAGKQPLVIFFYPKDNAPVCTAEACSFRDSFAEFNKLDAKIIGVSSDNVISHRSFSKKNKLPYILLSDHKKRIQKLFGVSQGFLGLRSERVTYIANKEGVIIYIFKNHYEAQSHINEALKALKKEIE